MNRRSSAASSSSVPSTSPPSARPIASTKFLVGALALLIILAIGFLVYGDRWFVANGLLAARAELRAGDPAAAVARLQALDRRYPGRAEVLYQLAIARRRTGDYQAAGPILDQAELLGWNPDDLAIQRALLASRAGRFSEVRRLLEQAVERGVDDETAADIYEATAEGHIALYEFRDAWQCLSYWTEWQPGELKPRLLRGTLAERVGNREDALNEFRIARDIAPDRSDVQLKVASVLLAMLRVDEALVEFQAGRDRFPDELAFSIGAASCLRRTGKTEEARTLLTDLLERRLPTAQRAAVLTEFGELETESGDYPKAIGYLESAVKLTPREAHVQFALCQAYQFAGRTQEADVHRKISRRLQDALEELHAKLALLLDEPQRVDLRHDVGRLMYANGFTTEALGWWTSGLRIDPRHTPTHRALADHYRAQGDATRAAWHDQRAASQEPPSPQEPAQPPASAPAAEPAAKPAEKPAQEAPDAKPS